MLRGSVVSEWQVWQVMGAASAPGPQVPWPCLLPWYGPSRPRKCPNSAPSLAGAVQAWQLSYIDPPTVFGLNVALVPIAMALLGGSGKRWGPLIGVILASWAIAFIEYCLAVPANRWGSAVYTTAQLKTMQEVITLLVFAGFSVAYLKEPLGWNHLVGFALISAGAFFVFQKW